MAYTVVAARELVGGSASGKILFSHVGLSFWGGVDPLSGIVIDHTHPLHGKSVANIILAIPNGRGDYY
jgi:predicted aconitase with swiveling domain